MLLVASWATKTVAAQVGVSSTANGGATKIRRPKKERQIAAGTGTVLFSLALTVAAFYIAGPLYLHTPAVFRMMIALLVGSAICFAYWLMTQDKEPEKTAPTSIKTEISPKIEANPTNAVTQSPSIIVSPTIKVVGATAKASSRSRQVNYPVPMHNVKLKGAQPFLATVTAMGGFTEADLNADPKIPGLKACFRNKSVGRCGQRRGI